MPGTWAEKQHICRKREKRGKKKGEKKEIREKWKKKGNKGTGFICIILLFLSSERL